MKLCLWYVMMDFSRWLGSLVCRLRDHRYYHPGGLHDTACIYYCLRCNEPHRPENSLQPIEYDPYGDDYPDYLELHDEQEYERARRWFSRLPYPKWI